MEANPVLGTFGCIHGLAEIVEAHHISAILQILLNYGHDLVIRRERYTPLITELWTLSILDTFVDEGPNCESDVEFLDSQNMSRSRRPQTVDHAC